MLSLHTNAASLTTQRNLNNTQNSLSNSMTRLGTGYRINSAMDDAAGLQIATRLDAQSRGMEVAMKNTQNSISLLQTGEGALGEVSNILLRMKDLATEAANGSSTDQDKQAMQSEFDQMGQELHNISSNTTFGGRKLLVGGVLAGPVTFQIGAGSGETMKLDTSSEMNAMDESLKTVSSFYSASTPSTPGSELQDHANQTIDTINQALTSVGAMRSIMGASANRLDHINNNLSNVDNNTLVAKGRIMDTDYAKESANMTSQQMLTQAGNSMLKQSNNISSLVMTLMQ